MTQGRVEYKSAIPRGMDEGLDLGEACVCVCVCVCVDLRAAAVNLLVMAEGFQQ